MDEQLIRDELQRVLNSKVFTRSNRLSNFLSYIVESTLDGTSPVLSEVTIAQDVFGKTETFDPKKDATIRVSANRLRKSLDAYYQKQGAQNPVRISIPLGAYTPVFQTESNPKRSHILRKTSLFPVLAAVAATFILIGGGYFLTHVNSESSGVAPELVRTESYPTIVVLPFQNMTGEEVYDNLESQFQRQVVRDLYAFDFFKIAQANLEASEILSDENAPYDYIIRGRLISLEPELKIFAELTDVKTQEVITENYFTHTEQQSDYFANIAQISAELATAFASHRGILMHRNMDKIAKRLDANALEGSNLTAFECFALFEQHFSVKTVASYKTARTCIDTELEKNPNDATLLAAKAILYLQIAYLNQNPTIKNAHPVYSQLDLNPAITKEMAHSLSRKAVSISPKNDFALTVWAEIQISNKEYEGGLFTLEQILEVKPYDPDVISSYANLQSLMGNFDEAIRLSKESLRRTTKPQHYHFLPLLFSAVAQKDLATLREYIQPFKDTTTSSDQNVLIFETTISILENDIESVEADKAEHEKLYKTFEGDLFANLKNGAPAPERTIAVLEELFDSVGIKTKPE